MALPSVKKAKKNAKSKDPIRKILRTNLRGFKLTNNMNALLLKILERYDLDKPILMQDKLDVIWEKSKEKQASDLLEGEQTEENASQFAVKYKLSKRKV